MCLAFCFSCQALDFISMLMTVLPLGKLADVLVGLAIMNVADETDLIHINLKDSADENKLPLKSAMGNSDVLNYEEKHSYVKVTPLVREHLQLAH
jgi:hypothetical protein